MSVILTEKNVTVEDSWQIVSPKEMITIINTLREYVEEANITMDTPLNHRSNWSMMREWIASNNLYALCYNMDKTGSVSFTYPQKWYTKLGHFLGSVVLI